MRTILGAAAAIALAFSSAVSLSSEVRGADDDGERIPLTVHEWGTFTFVQGSDGVTLEGLQHDDFDLPSFVERRDRVSSSNQRTKMETPVTYFYTPKERDVNVSVGFPSGVFTQWYPRARAFAPALADESGEAPPLAGGELTWGGVHLIPPAQFDGTLPDVEGKTHYLHARDVDAAIVRLCGTEMQYERFLFYRGLGTLRAPLATKSLQCDESPGALTARIEIRNPGTSDLAHVYVLAVKEGRGRFVYIPLLRAGETVTPSVAVGADAPELDAMVAEVQRHLASSLRMLGLYEKEAWAMVRTWAESYFRNEGVRVLCAMPTSVIDAVLPLRVEPKPDATVRVMIARVECVTPSQERIVNEEIARLGSADAAEAKRASEKILAMGRIAEPLLRRSVACCGTAARPDLVNALLRAFHPDR